MAFLLIAIAVPSFTSMADKSTVDVKSDSGSSSGKSFEKKIYTANLDKLAELTGKTTDEIKAMMKDGNSVWKIADESGKLAEYKDYILQSLKSSLDDKVANGKITQEKADEIYKNAQDKMATVTGDTKFEMPGKGKKYFNGGFKGFSSLTILAQVTGKTEDDVKALIKDGNSTWKIASDAGKLDEYKAALLENLKGSLDKMVADNKLTQEQADSIYNKQNEKISSATADTKDNIGNCAKGQKRSFNKKDKKSSGADTSSNTSLSNNAL